MAKKQLMKLIVMKLGQKAGLENRNKDSVKKET
jgi:hypothetical protein